jgi:hypothetical protein
MWKSHDGMAGSVAVDSVVGLGSKATHQARICRMRTLVQP